MTKGMHNQIILFSEGLCFAVSRRYLTNKYCARLTKDRAGA